MTAILISPVRFPERKTTSVQLSKMPDARKESPAKDRQGIENLSEKTTEAETICRTVMKTPKIKAPSQVVLGVTPYFSGKYSKTVWAVEMTSSLRRRNEITIPAKAAKNDASEMPVNFLFIVLNLAFLP